MPRMISELIFTKEDYEKIRNMDPTEVINTLDEIDNGYLGSSHYYGQDDYEGSERDYDYYRLHTALSRAVELIKDKYCN